MDGLVPAIHAETLRSLRKIGGGATAWMPRDKRGHDARESFGNPLLLHFQRGDEGLLRNLDAAELAHLLLAFLLLLQELALAGHVAAVAFRGHVLAEGAHRFARDDLAADRRLNRHLEHVRRDQLL